MVAWILKRHPQRVVDAGCGSGRFALAVTRARPDLSILAVDVDPVATLLCRANLNVLGARRAQVIQGDYTTLTLNPIAGRTAFVGNPPYVRHHQMSPRQKAWATSVAAKLGLKLSGLAGLHVHFFLAAALQARPGDIGCFVTSAEWLDVNYGAALRHLLADWLGAESIHLLNPDSVTFEDAMTTAAITCFRAGDASPEIRFRLVNSSADLGDLDAGGSLTNRNTACRTARWGTLLKRPHSSDQNANLVPLGTLVRVSRGIATGANEFFLLNREEARRRGLTRWVRPVISRAEEIFASLGTIRDSDDRKMLLDLPGDLDLDNLSHQSVRDYLAEGESLGIPKRYLCSHRRPWWRLGAGAAPPIVATYMARQAPGFALNVDGLALVNVVHGLYPRTALTSSEMRALVTFLNEQRPSYRGAGRTYQGGLEKFEPREMEALLVPSQSQLERMAMDSLEAQPEDEDPTETCTPCV